MQLASELKAAARQAALQRNKEEAGEFARDLREAKKIAREIIADLPSWCNMIARSNHERKVYIPHIFSYKPWAHKWPRKDGRNRTRGCLTKWRCQRYLLGVSRIVALWAIKEGLAVHIGYTHNGTARQAVMGLKPGENMPWDECLIISW